MEFVVIILFVAAIVLVNFLVGRIQRRRAGRPAAPKAAATPARGARPAGRAPAGASLEVSREAAARLDEAGHRQVYAAIAQGQPIRAIQVYAQLTGCGLRAASAAVASLASHPVPLTRPAPKPDPAADSPAADETAQGIVGPAPADTTGRDTVAEPAAGSSPENAAPESTHGGGSDAETAGESAAQDSAAQDAAASGTPGKGTEKRNNSQTLPDEAEISKWAQNLRPEDF